MQAEFQNLPIKNIEQTGNNPRTINEKGDAFVTLLKSIEAQGVIVPIHVRAHPTKKGKFELLAGERRLCASARAKREAIPAINHGKINDEDAFEITFTENYAREDLTPLEQGKAASLLLLKFKGDATAAAAKMGKSVTWILQRNAIEKNLSPKWKKSILENDYFVGWTAAHLQIIASLPRSVQDEFLEDSCCEPPNVQNLKKQIAARLRLLVKAPWQLDDATLTKDAACICLACSKRSSAQPGLFDETTEDAVIKKNDRCLDLRCWKEKLSKYLELRAGELRAKHNNLIYAVLPGEQLEYYDRIELGRKFGSDYADKWKSAKEGDKGAVPALIIHGYHAGELRWIKFPKASTTAGRSRNLGPCGKPKPSPLKERREKLDKKRWSAAIRILVEQLGKVPVTALVTKDKIRTVMALALVYGTSGYYPQAPWKKFAKKTDRKKVLAELWVNIRTTICEGLNWSGPITQTPDNLIAGAKFAAKLTNINIRDIFKTVSKEDYPKPKSWALLNENGTPKKAKKNGKRK